MRIEPAVVIRDLFFQYKKFDVVLSDTGSEFLPKKIVLITGYAKLVLFKICLIKREDAISCGDRCCDPGDKCDAVARVCQGSGLCLDECCDDKDCLPPSVCSLSTKQCRCPYECCSDGECSDGKFCDGATHQCTTENHVRRAFQFLCIIPRISSIIPLSRPLNQRPF
jgi:hypothetical protein